MPTHGNKINGRHVASLGHINVTSAIQFLTVPLHVICLADKQLKLSFVFGFINWLGIKSMGYYILDKNANSQTTEQQKLFFFFEG